MGCWNLLGTQFSHGRVIGDMSISRDTDVFPADRVVTDPANQAPRNSSSLRFRGRSSTRLSPKSASPHD